MIQVAYPGFDLRNQRVEELGATELLPRRGQIANHRIVVLLELVRALIARAVRVNLGVIGEAAVWLDGDRGLIFSEKPPLKRFLTARLVLFRA